MRERITRPEGTVLARLGWSKNRRSRGSPINTRMQTGERAATLGHGNRGQADLKHETAGGQRAQTVDPGTSSRDVRATDETPPGMSGKDQTGWASAPGPLCRPEATVFLSSAQAMSYPLWRKKSPVKDSRGLH